MEELRSEWFWVDGLRVHARTNVGPQPAGPETIVLVHGLVVSSRYMRRLLARLGPWFRTWAPDLPGFGRSEDPGRLYSLPELADALVAWMDAAGVARATLVGNSFGCQISAEVAVRYPERVARLVFQGPTAEPGTRTVPRQIRCFLRNSVRDKPSVAPIMLRDYWDAGWRRFVHTFRVELEDAIEVKLPSIDVPVLVLSGERDPITRPEWGQRVATMLPRGRHVILAGAAHTAVWGAARQVARAIQAFLREEPVPDRIEAAADTSPRYVASFDSASGMLRANRNMLHREDFPGLGLDRPVSRLVPLANWLPVRLREKLYSVSGWLEAIPERDLENVRLSEIDQWLVSELPWRRYPAVFIGSSGGAVLHLAAAMSVPYLPQTLLIPVRRFGSDVNDVRAAMEWGREPGEVLLQANPDLQLHHMHDPNQDHLMSRHMAYFRVKRRRLGPIWEQFLRHNLAPGGIIFQVECEQSWPCTRVDERHWFQSGGVGGLEPWEYLRGSPRVADFLRRRGAEVQSWNSPPPDAEVPEAEWGFEPALGQDLTRFAEQHGYRVRHLRFRSPDGVSGAVADLYRDWYRDLGLPGDRLLSESFILVEPWWALRTGSVPYWCSFAVEPAAQALDEYLAASGPYAYIHAMLFSHGVPSAGLAPIERWRELLGHALAGASFIGVDPGAFPRDFAVLRRYHTELPRRIPTRQPMPAPMPVERVQEWLERRHERMQEPGTGS